MDSENPVDPNPNFFLGRRWYDVPAWWCRLHCQLRDEGLLSSPRMRGNIAVRSRAHFVNKVSDDNLEHVNLVKERMPSLSLRGFYEAQGRGGARMWSSCTCSVCHECYGCKEITLCTLPDDWSRMLDHKYQWAIISWTNVWIISYLID